ncbi:tyrosine-protein kinase isoform SRK4-like [Planoprotostelium fungivorum]|uniref:Tyrosine-protein kinase isoform SRK4-like n=1 Tax=Planoprotostelium fungivorum TaxID=1890364 RepID=A0A2P6NAJ3_9EUKA|nr:tyrosine-protein kinase isoform SRK4-like [Planoprotostelium fungivorum]
MYYWSILNTADFINGSFVEVQLAAPQEASFIGLTRRDNDNSNIVMRVPQMYFFLLLVVPSIALFDSGYIMVNNSYPVLLNNSYNQVPLISISRQWKMEFTAEGWPQIVAFSSPGLWRWRPNNTSRMVSSDSLYRLFVQDLGNVVWENSTGSPLWSTNRACGVSSTPNGTHGEYTIRLSNEGQLVHTNVTGGTEQILWRSPIVTSLIYNPALTTDGGFVYALYPSNRNGNTVQLDGSAVNNIQGVPSIVSITPINATDEQLRWNATIFIPPGVGSNLTLTLQVCNSSIAVPFFYPSPVITVVEVRPSIIHVEGRNAGFSSQLSLLDQPTKSYITRMNVKGGTFSVDLLVPSDVPSGYYSLTLAMHDQPPSSKFVNYTSPVDAVQAIQVNGSRSVSQIFTSIESIAENALKTSDSFEVTNREGVSVYAAVVDQKGNETVGSINGTGINFSIPSTIIQDLLSGGNTTATVILSRISSTQLFPQTQNVTTVGDIIGLTLYLNGSYTNVTNTSERITITIPLPVNVTVTEEMRCVYWAEESRGWKRDGCDTERGQSSITCLCSHLTNFTVGIINSEKGRGMNKMYLLAILGIIPIAIASIIIALFVNRRRRTKNYSSDFDLTEYHEIEIERQVGRGRETVVYVGKKAGTTQVAVKKTAEAERSKELQREANMLKDMHHPNILMCLGMYREAEMTCMVMDYMDGGTLADVLRSGRIEKEEEIRDIMAEIAAGLSYLHENGHVHGRVCPQKVYVTSSHHVKLSAYGHANIPPYMEKYLAPEVKRTGRSTIEGDIFSFGIVFSDVMNERKNHLRCGQKSSNHEISTLGSPKERMKMTAVGQRLKPVNQNEIRNIQSQFENVYQLSSS